ncbi:probable carboxylesterase 18, partial [Euphorbia lathyris]|uniref:probable carboxylesterase 18 n=1 Tax=Euphorbia lathyris TaxID=212925 RepID=UPI00331362B4
NITRRADGSVNRRLMSFFDRQSSPSNKPINGVKSTDITIDKSRDLWFRLFTPTAGTTSNHSSLLVILFFHGGGFSYLSPSLKPYDDFCRRLARELSTFVISVNYLLAPEHRYPAQIEDCFDTLKFIDTAEIEGFSSNADLNWCFMAGGSLVHHVTVKASGYEFSKLNLIGNIAIQPFFGGEERTESELRLTKAPFVNTERSDWMWKAFLSKGSNRDHPATNVMRADSVDISGIKFPATIVVVGGFDALVDWQRRYYDWLKKNGKEAYLIEYES